MAYSVNDVFNLLTNSPIAVGAKWWYHESADALATVNTADFITDGNDKGLKVGDFVYHLDTTAITGDLSLHRVITVGATGLVDLSDGTVVSAGANAD